MSTFCNTYSKSEEMSSYTNSASNLRHHIPRLHLIERTIGAIRPEMPVSPSHAMKSVEEEEEEMNDFEDPELFELRDFHKRQIDDDYGHLRFGKRDRLDDYGHAWLGQKNQYNYRLLRVGKRNNKDSENEEDYGHLRFGR